MAKKKRKKPISRDEAAAKRDIKNYNYKERVKKMRPYFGDMFKAKSGFDLRKHPSQWDSRDRARITKYYRVIAPQLARTHKARRYRIPEHLNEAIYYTQQEQLLKGQTAALFAVEKKESLDVRFDKRGVIRVRRQGVSVDKVEWDMDEFIRDPTTVIEAAVKQIPGAKRYKIMMGPHESKGSWTANKLAEAVAIFAAAYDPDKMEAMGTPEHSADKWLVGIVGYFGRSGREVGSKLVREAKQRKIDVKAREVERARIRNVARTKARRKRRGKRARLKGRL